MNIENLLRVILNDQAYLFALIQEQKALLIGDELTPEKFESYQDEWIEMTKGILEELDERDD